MASLSVSTIVWIVSGRLCPIAFEVDPVEDLQGLEQVGPLGPRPALGNGQTAIRDRRPALRSASCGWPGRRSGSARRWLETRRRCDARSGRDRTRRRHHRKPRDRSRAGDRLSRRSLPAPRRRREFRSSARGRRARPRDATVGASNCRVGATTSANVMVPNRSSRVRQASSAAGTAAASIPLAGIPPGP